MIEWFNPERGYYRAKYLGKTLEVVRNPDATDSRRYIARVDGVACPRPCFTIPQAKTKAMKWAEHPGLYDPVAPASASPPQSAGRNGSVVPYRPSEAWSEVEPGMPTVVDNAAMMEFRIVGKIPADQFAHAIAHLKATVDMLRDEGAIAECDIDPPPKVRL
jgi:hypothetical protein